MAHQSLYRRYRPQRFSEIRGQHHVRQALQNAVRDGRWGHAYLFSGPRGTGKTSTARVLAKALNCQDLGDDGEPCTRCESCLAIEQGRSFDLHELDAASNNKVDDIRDLISKVALGSPGRTKVYILDEVHMLSTGAENALLKTLEEPPEHVVFVLATTEPHKVTKTITSRTQHFEFHLLAGDELAEHVRWVITDAGLDVGDEAVDYVLRAGGGSARDTLSALDLVTAAGGIPAGSQVAAELARAVGAGDPAAALASVQAAMVSGREPRTIAEETLAHLRDAFLHAMGGPLPHLSDLQSGEVRLTAGALSPATLTRALEALGAAIVEMRQAPDPRIPFEVCLLRLARRTGEDHAALLQRVEALEIEVAALRAAGVAIPTADRGGPSPASQASPAPRPAEPTPETSSADTPTTPSSPPSASSSVDAAPQPVTERPAAAQAPSDEPSAAPQAPVNGDHPATSPPPPPRDRPAAAARRSLEVPDGEARRAPRKPPPVPTPPDTPGPAPTSARRSEDATAAAGPRADSPPSPAIDDTGPVADAITPAPVAAAAEGPAGTLDLSALEAVWSSSVLDGLANRARARYKPGRFLSLDGGVARFGLPNPIHRDRCAELVGEVEAALSAAVGRPVTLRLEVDATAAPEAGRGPGSGARPSNQPADDTGEDVGDIGDLTDASDVASSGIERLTRAFPGSEVITHDD
jgi:DNA polymerase III subunit gamma/tau